MKLDYLTNEFIRTEVKIHGMEISNQECDRYRAEVQRLYDQGEFHHTGVYWVANRLAADSYYSPPTTKKLRASFQLVRDFMYAHHINEMIDCLVSSSIIESEKRSAAHKVLTQY